MIRYILLSLILTIGGNAVALQDGILTGKVVDRFNQQPISGAVIEIDGLDMKAGSDDDGYFEFGAVPQGIYSVRFSSFGYIQLVVDNIVVNSGVVTDILAEMDIVETDEILVEEERFVKPGDISTSFKNLSYEEIRRSPGGFEDVGRVVQTLPGVSFVNDGRNDLIVRGGAPTENLFIVDNSPIPNINHFGSQGATGGPVSIINLNLVRDVNFITGGFSAKYGDKLSSVLEIRQREGNRKMFMGDINLSATGFGALFEGPIGSERRGSWLVSARRSYLDLIFNAAGFGFVPEYYSFQGKVVYDLDEDNFLTFNFINNIDKVSFNNDDEEKKQENSLILDNDQWGYVTAAEWKSLLSANSYSVLTFTRNYTNFDYTGRDTGQAVYFKNLSKEGETSLKAEYFVQPFISSQLSFGIEGKYIKFVNEITQQQDTSYFINPATNTRYIIQQVSLADDNITYKASAYAQWTQFLMNRFKLNFGLRYDYFDFIDKKSYISSRASASVNLVHNLYLNLSYGIFYQSPSYVWLVSDPSNVTLENIRADHYIAGFEYIFLPDLKASIEVYHKDYDNYPVSNNRPYLILSNNGGNFEKKGSFIIEPMLSAGKGYSNGIELFIQKTLTDNYYFNVSLSLFRAKYTALDGVERNSDFNNRILFTTFGGFLFGDGYQISGKIRYAGGRPYTPINPVDGTQLVSEYNSVYLPDYYSFDVRFDKKWSFANWTLVTYIDVQNITNRKNISGYEWNRYKSIIEPNEGIGIIPSIGINAMF